MGKVGRKIMRADIGIASVTEQSAHGWISEERGVRNENGLKRLLLTLTIDSASI